MNASRPAMQVETLIIGAGIAGAAMAHALLGEDILVVEAAEVAGGASGNPKGLIRPFLSFGNSEMREFYHAAYQECLMLQQQIKGDHILQTGVLQLPKVDEVRFPQAAELAGLGEEDLEYLTPQQTSARLGTECRSSSIYWRCATVVDPMLWAQALFGDTPIQTNTRIIQLKFENSQWFCTTSQGETITARQVIITAGDAIDLLPLEIAAQIRPRAGQISFMPHDALPILPHALSFGNYWIPPGHATDRHLIGATFDISARASVTAEGHLHNISALQNLAEILPELRAAANELTPEICTGRAAVRATTRNHMPLYGHAADGLYYLTGLGSRGLMSAPYVARQLRNLMDSTGNTY